MIKPKIHKISEIKFLQQENNSLQNGIKLSSFYNNDINALKIDFVFPAGRIFQEKAFISAMTNAIIREGSNQHPNSAEIEEKLDYFGIFVQQRIETYWSIFSFYIPLMYLEKALPIIHEILFDPIIDQVSLDFLKEKGKSGLIKQLKKPAFLARQHAMKMLWGENHPMGYFPKSSDFDNLSREDLIQFYNTYYKNSQFNIYVSGNFPRVFISKIDTLFGQHPVEAILPEPKRFLKDRKSETLIQKEEKQVQTALYWTAPCIGPGHSDYFDFKIMNTVFGDYFGSRLMTNIREEKAYTYGIYSSISPKTTGTNISIQAEVGKAYLDDTIKQIDLEIDNMKTQLIKNYEIEIIQKYMSGELLSVFDGVFNHASVLRYLDEMNLDFTYYKHYIDRIQSITPEAIREAARKHLNSEMFHKVCIG
jgi:zinc protease